jgi:hypothetical protein
MGGVLSPSLLNAEMKNTTAYGVQVKRKPNTVIKIPTDKTYLTHMSEYDCLTFENPSFHINSSLT